MTKKYFATHAITCLLLVLGGSALHAADAEWTTLISGNQGLENFTQLGDANWNTNGDSIEATQGSAASFLVTPKAYGDFELQIEFWASDDANSGIFLRCQDPASINDRNCYEANIFDQRPDPSFGTGGIVHIAPVSEPAPKAGNRWNSFQITLQGSHLVVVMNGETTVDVQDTQFASGPIALQWGRGTIRFRQMQIREL